jgi:50S ribosomal protein L16 3-hydroxylase
MARVKRDLLGGLSAKTFLRRHWQKTPLLVRGAVPGFGGVLTLRDMLDLATRDDCESRLIVRDGVRWTVEHGPFRAARLRRLPARNWTLLVQGVEQFSAPGMQLLSHFGFIPHCRLDDLMVSFAAPGGGVGPHFDSYDVFLLQGPGQRRWRVGRQRDLSLRPDVPLKILRHFRHEGEAVLRAGDMLYLPPHCAHDGTAIDDCFTYSIGFRAPSHQELASGFLAYLEDRLDLPGRYADPGLEPAPHPGRIVDPMLDAAARVLDRIRWGRRDVVEFLGTYLSEPKQQARFRPPARPLALRTFARAARRHGLRLAPGSRMLYAGSWCFINGESMRSPAGMAALRRLADARRLSGRQLPAQAPATDQLYQWYRAGYIVVED